MSYVQALEVGLAGQMGVSIDGFNGSVPGDDEWNVAASNNTLVLPPMDPYGPETRWIDIYSRGNGAFSFNVTPANSYVKVSPSSGMINPTGNNTDVRVQVSVDWASVPTGSWIEFINVTSTAPYGDYGMPSVNLPLNKTSVPDGFHGFVESDKTISIEPQHSSRNTSTNSTYYANIPGYGRTLSGVTLLPVSAESQTGADSPRLEYDFYAFTNITNANITAYLGTNLNVNPSRPLKYAVALDDAAPKVVQYVPSTPLGTLPTTWDDAVSNAVWTNTTTHDVTVGKHTLNFWAMEPGVVVQKLVVDLGGVRSSYLGPPESMIV